MNSSMEDGEHPQYEPGTPPRPPYSPVTPVLSHKKLSLSMPSDSTIPPPPPPLTPTAPITTTQKTQTFTTPADGAVKPPGSEMSPPPQVTRQPAPALISERENENPDAIALRSAISVLQMQKRQAEREIRTLDRMKRAAAEDPEGFVRELLRGSLESRGGDLFHPTAPGHEASEQQVKIEEEDEAEEEDGGSGDRMEVDGVERSSGQQAQRRSAGGEPETARFGAIPKPQNVVRMPHVNWAKYHIIGEPLDKLHEEQRKRPSPGEPRRGMPVSPSRAPEHHVAAPYRPFAEKIDPGLKARDSNKPPREKT